MKLSPTVRAFVAFAVFVAMQLGAGVFTAYFLYRGSKFAAAMSYALIITGLLAWGMLYLLQVTKPKSYNFRRVRWRRTPLAFVSALAGIVAMNLLLEKAELPNRVFGEILAIAGNPWGILAIALVMPVVEEVVFRESIIKAMMSHENVHRWEAVLVSALVFGVIHLNPAQVPFAFGMGIILGVIYVKTRNVVVTSLIHIFNNTLAIIEMHILGDRVREFSYDDVLGGPTGTWIIAIVCTAIAVVSLRRFWLTYHYPRRYSHHHHHRSQSSSSDETNSSEK